MAKAPSASRPCTLAPAGWPQALQPIERVFILACAVESRGVQRGTVASEKKPRVRAPLSCMSDAYFSI